MPRPTRLTLVLSAALASSLIALVATAPGKPSKDEVESTLAKIRLPKGFSISLYAMVPGARTLAAGKEGKAIFVGSDDSLVHVMTPGGEKAVSVDVFAPSMKFTMPHGLCFSQDGALFLVERNRVTRFDDAENAWRDAVSKASVVVTAGDLIPRSEENRNHAARVCAVGPDNKLYISLGQPYNVTPREKLMLYEQTGIGGIIRMNLDGTGRSVFARGIRNSVGMEFDADGALWFTDNQVDGMGDDVPPEEINRADQAGRNFGFPSYGGGHVRTNEYVGDEEPKGVAFPIVETQAHAASLGLTFYRGAMFPSEYRGGIFVAQHGSWDRSVPTGARVIFVRLAPDRKSGVATVFAEGWSPGNAGYLGRPADVAELADGSLLVTDDQNGAVYRIVYRAP